MAKVIGPLHSTSASGTIGKAITFGKNQAGAWVRGVYKKIYTKTESQDLVRYLFKLALDKWKTLNLDDFTLWSNVTKKGRWGRCQFMSEFLQNDCEEWPNFPIPQKTCPINITDKVVAYSEIISDLETLTGLVFCMTPSVFALKSGMEGIGGLALAGGDKWVVPIEDTVSDGMYHRTLVTAHELTHCLLDQHGLKYSINTKTLHETVAKECSIRVVEGELVPLYQYQGKTLSEWVPNPSC